jgi:hypothetical protein
MRAGFAPTFKKAGGGVAIAFTISRRRIGRGNAPSAAAKKGLASGQKAMARANMDYGGNRRISYDFSAVLL